LYLRSQIYLAPTVIIPVDQRGLNISPGFEPVWGGKSNADRICDDDGFLAGDLWVIRADRRSVITDVSEIRVWRFTVSEGERN